MLRRERSELEQMRIALNGEAHKYHPLLVADYRSRKGTPCRIAEMASAFCVHRQTIYLHLRKCVAEGLMSEDELQRRPRY